MILFLHGLDGSPNGRKISFLRDRGHKVIAPELPRNDFKMSLEIARRAMRNNPIVIIIGSCRGGAIAMEIEPESPVVLLAPAWKNFGVHKAKGKERYIVFHSREDRVIPFSDSEEMPWNLIEVFNDDHRLSHENTLELLIEELDTLAMLLNDIENAKDE